MAKGQDSKKAVKKKPEKTMKEKRNEKKEKKANKKQIDILGSAKAGRSESITMSSVQKFQQWLLVIVLLIP